jgi:hypothetical protein
MNKQIFNDNNNIATFVQSSNENLFGVCSRGNDSRSPPTGFVIEGHEIESMISMIYPQYRMVFERIKANGGLIDYYGNAEVLRLDFWKDELLRPSIIVKDDLIILSKRLYCNIGKIKRFALMFKKGIIIGKEFKVVYDVFEGKLEGEMNNTTKK